MKRLGRILLSLGCMLALGTLAPSAFADSYTYSTSGAFTGSGSSSETFTQSGTSATLTFTNVGTTNSPGGSILLGSLSFAASGTGIETYSDTFSLNVNFTVPAGTSGGAFTALLSGNVFGGPGGATLSFNPVAQTFTSSAGSFVLTLDSNPIQVSSSNPWKNITATISAVPEPSAALLLGVGILGLAGGRVRRSLVRL